MTTINTNTDGTTAFVVTPDTTGTFVVNTGSGSGSTAMTLDSSQNMKFNSGFGSVATAYACRAWVSFNGTGTVSIYASANVTSITDVAVGRYEINFTNAMPDANYVISGTGGNSTGTTTSQRSITRDGTWTTTVCQIRNLAASSATDDSFICVAVFR